MNKAGAKEEEADWEAGGSLCLWGEKDWSPRGGAGRGGARRGREVATLESWATFAWELQPSKLALEESPLFFFVFVFGGSQDSLCSTIQGHPPAKIGGPRSFINGKTI